jgi:hypothetical protein
VQRRVFVRSRPLSSLSFETHHYLVGGEGAPCAGAPLLVREIMSFIYCKMEYTVFWGDSLCDGCREKEEGLEQAGSFIQFQ